MNRSTAEASLEAVVCERFAPDGLPHLAFLSGPDEIALLVGREPERWLLLAVKSGRLEDAVAAVAALRALEARLAAVPSVIGARLDEYGSRPDWQAHGTSAGASWSLFKHNLLGEVRSMLAGEGDGERRSACALGEPVRTSGGAAGPVRENRT